MSFCCFGLHEVVDVYRLRYPNFSLFPNPQLVNWTISFSDNGGKLRWRVYKFKIPGQNLNDSSDYTVSRCVVLGREEKLPPNVAERKLIIVIS